MRTEPVVIEAFRIFNAPNLDPITVMIERGNGSGSITLACWGKSWTAFFGACGGDIAEFFVQCHPPYLEGKMSDVKTLKRDREYLTRIIVAVQSVLKERER